ncbi:unnamed protein product, partial [Notodromas monacha]
MFSCCKSSKEPETERKIRANDPEYNAQFQYATRASRAETEANVDDKQRHRNDSKVNNRKAFVLRPGKGQLVEEKWSQVLVGDVVRLSSDDFVTADLLLLSTSEPNGLCYIETAELDGETNLKARQCLPETHDVLGNDPQLLSAFNGAVWCEPPNNNLSRFEGTLEWDHQSNSGDVEVTSNNISRASSSNNISRLALDNDKVLLRGCVLRNTQWAYGLVLFAGQDTKLMMNSGKTKFKRTSIDRLMNVLILGIVLFLVLMCLWCTIAAGIWETVTGHKFQSFMPWDSLIPEDATSGATVIAILIFFSYLIALNTVVPISLYVSVEIIRLLQSLLINWDEKMYYEEKDTPAKARTTTLNEELGQIEYIFSDKTGTLTQNIMTFNKCSIGGKMYGDPPVVIKTAATSDIDDMQSIDLSEDNPFFEPEFKFYDPVLLMDVKSGNQAVHEFFRVLALCHTVMPDHNRQDGKLVYQAQSPDEEALVSAARNFGFVFKERTPNTITTIEMGVEKKYELLCILDFNNVRKRMSVVVREDNNGSGSETAINIGYSCELLTDEMHDEFIVDASSYKDVEAQLGKYIEVIMQSQNGGGKMGAGKQVKGLLNKNNDKNLGSRNQLQGIRNKSFTFDDDILVPEDNEPGPSSAFALIIN